MKRLSRFEFIFLSLIILGAINSAAYLFFNHPEIEQSSYTEKESLGFVHPQGGDVRLKGEDEAGWNQINRDANIYNRDRVFTGAGSSAVVDFKNKGNFVIEPNSLIVISSAESSMFDLDEGSFFGNLAKGAKIMVKSNDGESTEIESHGAHFRIESNKGKGLSVVVFKGQAKLHPVGSQESKVIKANEKAVVEKKLTTVQGYPIQLDKPSAGENLWDPSRAVNFSWVPVVENFSRPIYIEISVDPLFKKGTFRLDPKGVQLSETLGAGFYFWRARAVDNNEILSMSSSFTIYPTVPPVINKKSVVEIETKWNNEAIGSIGFAWSDISLTNEFKFQISQQADFSKILFEKNLNKSEIGVSGLKLGDYYWRVTSKHPSRQDLTSDVGVMTLVKKVSEPTTLSINSVEPEPVGLVENPSPTLPTSESQKTLPTENERSQLPFEVAKSPPKVLEVPALAKNPPVLQEVVKIPELKVHLMSPKEFGYGVIKDKRPVRVIFKWDIEGDYQSAELTYGKINQSLKAHTSKDVSDVTSLSQVLSEPGKYQWSIQVMNAPTNQKVIATGYFNLKEENTIAESLQLKLAKQNSEKVDRGTASAEAGANITKLDKAENASQDIINKKWFAFGGGFNFVQFDQSMTLQPEASYASLAGPSMSVRGGYQGESWGGELDYTQAPGSAKASSTTSISKNDFIWQATSLEALMRGFTKSNKYGAITGNYRLGAQYHSLPYIFTQDSQLVLSKYTMTALSAGFDAWFKSKSKWSYQVLMRFQQPISFQDNGDANFKATPQFAFDGSLGTQYLLKNNMTFGVFWYGQWHQYNYNILSGTEAQDSGSQKLFFSNMELRLGYEF